MSGLHVVGVRHHSPACARLVAHTVRAVRPRHVLVEGPADMNARLDELLLSHELPVAIFTAYRDRERTHASWTPFCGYSPEWVALEEGRAVGAQVRFMDLPAWHEAFHGVRNRYADRKRRRADYVEMLCRQLSVEGMDGLWDHLFEQPCEMDALAERLCAYFEATRGEEDGSEQDGPREEFMLRHVEAALAEGGPVVVVCGGFHAPVLARATAKAGASFPESPAHPAARSYLVPYSFRRLDSFTGYESGMPSPAFYQAVWEHGPALAPERMLQVAVEQLRKRAQPVSAADLIAPSTMAEALARLRGHRALARSDLLDGLAAALVKDALDAALPWTTRGFLSPDTHPLLAEVLRAFSGERRGRLSDRTPRPPLLVDVERTLQALDLLPARTRRLELDLTEPASLERSRALHRLRVLGIPGFHKDAGPAFPTDGLLREQWSLTPNDELESRVIEASGWGATLEQAAAGRLEEALLEPELDLGRLALLLSESLFAGIHALAQRVLSAVAVQAGKEPDLARLGAALDRLLSVWRHDVLLGARESADLGVIISAVFDRGLWLLEHVSGPSTPASEGHLLAIAALRDALRHAGLQLGLDGAHAAGVFERRMAAPDAPPAVRGASLGALWSLSRLTGSAAEEAAIRAIRGAALPATFGDFLAGLFALAREEVVRAPAVTAALDEVLRELPEEHFLVAVPALRLAFGYFPPQEKSDIARAVLALHGRSPAEATALLRLEVAPSVMAAGAALDEEVERVMVRFGLARPEVAHGA